MRYHRLAAHAHLFPSLFVMAHLLSSPNTSRRLLDTSALGRFSRHCKFITAYIQPFYAALPLHDATQASTHRYHL